MATKNLYRGKSAVDGQMVYGSLLITEIGGKDIYCIIPRANFTEFVNKLVSPRYNVWTKSGAANNSYIIQVDPKTVGQGTNECDKNCKEIFEGDIVEFFGMRGVITQASGAFGIMCSKIIDYDILESKLPLKNAAYFCYNDHFITLWELYWNYEQDDYPLSEVEIIGNIHDNPDLLKAEVADD